MQESFSLRSYGLNDDYEYSYSLNKVGSQSFSGLSKGNENQLSILLKYYELIKDSNVIDALETYSPFFVIEKTNIFSTYIVDNSYELGSFDNQHEYIYISDF